MLVRRRDVLAAQAELLDDHLLGNARSRSAISAAVIHRSGRYEAVAASPTVLMRLRASRMQRMMRSSSSQTTAGDRLAVAPEDPAHADQLAEAHQRVRRDLGVELADLAGLRRLAQRLDVAAREAVVVVAQHLGRDELGLADDPVERRVLGGEAEVRLEAEQLRLEPRRPCDEPSFIAWRTRRFRSRTSSSKIAFFESK